MTSSNDRVARATGGDSLDTIVVVGTGFIGLPLALLLAEHEKNVVGVDIDEKVVKGINDRNLNFDEDEFEALLASDRVNEHLEARTDPTEGDAFVISVPTPLAEPSKTPDISFVETALDSILPYLSGGDLVNIESTLPPRTFEKTIVPTLRQEGFEPGRDVQLAHSPERILPGNVFEEIRHNDRIIGGVDDSSRRRAAAIYEPFLEGDVYFTDLLSAELCKLLENTFRDVNIALANEFALIGEQLDLNMNRVIKLANNHPRVDILTPGVGVGGHCLPVDPWFLNEVDPEHTNLITGSRRINDKMPEVAARKIRQAVGGQTAPLILALGAAYKPETYDSRNSPAIEIVESLRNEHFRVEHYDRHVDGMGYDDLDSLIRRVEPDVVLQLVSHDTTDAELCALEPELAEAGVQLLRFGGENPLDPRQYDE
ncbi:nucleotide sugar dehydrogenase [Haladaptatus halobius]|uniref:nucleotide sugar dehydrogenase n=1 Tax=Haladaptatus halobius TaxID=2884875 RepID=UPI001D0A17C4|nr:nucleotide sugar dehydrogenase [Haladaptatus halobius]